MWNLGHAVAVFLQDARYGLRSFAKTRGFTTLAILTLALGIGSSSAVFSLIDAILIRPLPYPESGKIVLPWRLPAAGMQLGFDEFPWDRPSFLRFARESKAFQYVAAMRSDFFNLTGAGTPVRLNGVRVSAAFFPTLGVAPMLGRSFTAGEDQPGQEHVVVLSHSLWIERFGGDPNVIGRALDLNGAPYVVTGVMPPGFAFPRANQMPGSTNFPKATQLWTPIALPHGDIIRGEPSELAVIGRLRREAGVAQAQADLDAFAKRLVEEHPTWKSWVNTHVKTLPQQVAGDTQRPLLLIFGAVGVVLLISCCNVANLLLARSAKRKREFMLRAALGAGSARLVRQLLAESLVLALGGGILGLLLAQASISCARRFGPATVPRLSEVALDGRVFAFTLAVTLLTAALFGIVPGLVSRRVDMAQSLTEGARGTGRGAMRNSILVSEVALAVILVIATGLLVRTFLHIISAGSGFNPAHVLTFELTLPDRKYIDRDGIVELYRRELAGLRSAPGAQSAGIAEVLPVGGAGESTMLRIPERPVSDPRQRPYGNYTIVSPGYFAAIGTPLLRGRDFLESDGAGSQPVAIINQAMAKKYWPDRNPLGRAIGVPIRKYNMIIVGVVPDVKHLSLREEAAPEIYVPYTQDPWPSMLTMQAAVRTTAGFSTAVAYARQATRAADPELPIANVRMLRDLVSDSMARPRFSMLLVGLFGAFAVILAAVGIYGVISYSVAQRTKEIGIRMALGADRRDVFTMVLAQGARFVALGIALGIAGALILTPLMTSFLYGVRPADPLTFAAVSVFVIAVALAACYMPARRAMRLNAISALRCE